MIDNSTQAAVDFAKYIRNLNAELEDLEVELDRKREYETKLNGDVAEGAAALKNAQDELAEAEKTLAAEIKRCDDLEAFNLKRIKEIEEELVIIG